MCINLSQSPCCSWMEKDTSTKPWVSEFPDERHLTENDPLPIQFSKVTSTHFYPVSYNAHLHCTNTTAVVLLFSFQTCFFFFTVFSCYNYNIADVFHTSTTVY